MRDAAASPSDQAHALLDHPETYPGLVQHRDARRLLRLWRYPSFEPYCSWVVIEARSGLFLRRVVWDQRRQDLEPATYGSETVLRQAEIAEVLAELAAIRLAPFPTMRILGLDGTGCGVEQGEGFGSARLEWWDLRHPEDWAPLHRWHERTAARFDTLLPARSMAG
ncbi:hypothetical protein [Inquilinus sp. OTU3971]|uniref:hypothetical protein n=1 Tax=Inquilinus sp. OTU3971 TaxID=3043855 RepID=UPI00313E13AD